MRAFFEGIQSLFVDFLFWPMDVLRSVEPTSWTLANIMNWIFMIICTYFIVYWCKQLALFDKSGEENQDTTAHSFLK